MLELQSLMNVEFEMVLVLYMNAAVQTYQMEHVTAMEMFLMNVVYVGVAAFQMMSVTVMAMY